MPGVYETPPPAYGYPAPYGRHLGQPTVKNSVNGLSLALSVLLGLDALFTLGSIIGLIWRRSLLTALLDHPETVDRDSVDASDTLVRVADGLLVLTLLGSIVVFMCWFWAARSNAEAYIPGEGRMSVGWSIGGWFIPLANLVIPCIVARDVYRGTMFGRQDKRQMSGGLITGWWWASYVVSWVLMLRVSSASSTARDAEAEGFSYLSAMRDLTDTGLVALPVLAVSAVLTICYVQTISKVQRQRNAAGDWYDGPGSRAALGLPPVPPGYGYGYGAPVPGGYPMAGAPAPGGYPTAGPPPTMTAPMPGPAGGAMAGDLPGPWAAPMQDAVPPQYQPPAAETQTAQTQTAQTQTAEAQAAETVSDDPFAAPENLTPPS